METVEIINQIKKIKDIGELSNIVRETTLHINATQYDILLNTFVEELIKITGLSEQYCNSAFFTLQDWRKEKPKEAAEYYKKRFNL